MKMIPRLILVLSLTLLSSTLFAQQTTDSIDIPIDSIPKVTNTQQKIKLDGVATVIGKNIVLDSEIEAYKLQLLQQSEGKQEISTCDMLEQIMDRKLLSHHAVVDSIVATDAEVSSRVDRKISMLLQDLGSEERLIKFYGFNDMADFRKDFLGVEREAVLIERMQQKLTEKVDVTPDDVRNYYKSLEDKGNLPEFGAEIELAQIVLYAKPSNKEINRVLDKLKEIKQEVANGESFTMKTILYSEDPGVTSNKGFYTITKESGFVKEFKEAAFSMDEGEMSDPFVSDFGYHILEVEKIRGKQRDVRHLLMRPVVEDTEKGKTKDSLNQIRKDILTYKLTFEEAVRKYSEDLETKSNDGLLVNPQTSDTKFELTGMDPTLYARISDLKQGDITDVFFDETREGEQMYKIMYIKKKVPAHTADINEDYVKIQNLALQKKQQETIDKWAKDILKDTYIKINEGYKKCTFKNNWAKIN